MVEYEALSSTDGIHSTSKFQLHTWQLSVRITWRLAEQPSSYSTKAEERTIWSLTRREGAPQVALVVKNLPANAEDFRDMCSIPGSGRSHGGGHGNPFQ